MSAAAMTVTRRVTLPQRWASLKSRFRWPGFQVICRWAIRYWECQTARHSYLVWQMPCNRHCALHTALCRGLRCSSGPPGGSVDAYSISLCLKIFNRSRVLDEAFRVLRPGGRLIVLEASNIPWKPLHLAYLSYMSICMPALGWLAMGGDSSAYTYLLRGIRGFPTAEALALEIREHGFEDVAFERRSLGIVAIHSARKPGTRHDA
jgi:SAM-dependent methyltransferase